MFRNVDALLIKFYRKTILSFG